VGKPPPFFLCKIYLLFTKKQGNILLAILDFQ
jgi:hypothetical protein